MFWHSPRSNHENLQHQSNKSVFEVLHHKELTWPSIVTGKSSRSSREGPLFILLVAAAEPLSANENEHRCKLGKGPRWKEWMKVPIAIGTSKTALNKMVPELLIAVGKQRVFASPSVSAPCRYGHVSLPKENLTEIFCLSSKTLHKKLAARLKNYKWLHFRPESVQLLEVILKRNFLLILGRLIDGENTPLPVFSRLPALSAH